ncbi:MAG TPA: hypothetical protein VHP37_32275 [Burkholderiales bacterium]|nr:hypothetical protein [Burkholderiales bacterium]
MPKAATPADRLKALRGRSSDELAELLAELAATHPEVEERLARHALAADPARLAADFRTRLQGWKRSKRFYWRTAARGFARELEVWVGQIEHELLPLDAGKTHDLADAFVRSDARFFEQADDSDGAIGDAMRAGCDLWLRSAKAQPDRPASGWIERVHALVTADGYGAREALLRHADVLFDEPDLRALASRFEADLEKALRAPSDGDGRTYGLFKAAGAVGLIADALRDPDLYAKATLRYSPNPNPLQKQHFADRYIRYGRPAEALAWLEGDWGFHETDRQRLVAEAYEALGDTERLQSLRRALFDRTGSPGDFAAWRQSLAPGDYARAVEVAHARAQTLDDPIAGAQLLLALNDDAAAEALLVARQAAVQGESYVSVGEVALELEGKGRLLGAIVCYRALLLAILTRAHSKAYGHAAEYLRTLRRLDTSVVDYGPLETHETFESAVRTAHGRKTSFWNRVGVNHPIR